MVAEPIAYVGCVGWRLDVTMTIDKLVSACTGSTDKLVAASAMTCNNVRLSGVLFASDSPSSGNFCEIEPNDFHSAHDILFPDHLIRNARRMTAGQRSSKPIIRLSSPRCSPTLSFDILSCKLLSARPLSPFTTVLSRRR